MVAVCSGQGDSGLFDRTDWGDNWQASIHSGFFSGTTYLQTIIDGESVKVDSDTGWVLGGRLAKDGEYFGFDLTLQGVFQDLDISAHPTADQPSSGDAILTILGVNGLIYPFGDDWADGRVKFYLTAGPGLAFFNSDYSEADNETMFDFNAGTGVKFMLGDQDNPFVRLDWRWHYMTGADDLEDNLYCQELTIGIGCRF